MILGFKLLEDKNLKRMLFIFILFLCLFLKSKITKSQTLVSDSVKTTTLLKYIDSVSTANPELAYQFCDSIINSNRYKTKDVSLACAYKGLAILHFNRKEFDYAQNYYYKAITVFKVLNINNQLSRCNYMIGHCLRYKGKIEEAINQYKLTILLFEKDGDIKRVAYVNNELGRLYKTKGDFKKALDYYYIALNTFEQVKDNSGKALMYNNIADLFNFLKIFEPAEEYLFKSISLAKAGGYTSIECLANETLGTAYLQNNQLKEALDHLETSISLTKKPFTLGAETIVYIYISAANANILANNLNKATTYLKKADELNVDSSKTYEDSYYCIVKGRLLVKKGNLLQAEKEFDTALEYATFLESLPLKKDCLDELRKIYAATGRFEQAYQAEEQITKINNKIGLNEISNKVAVYLLNSKFEKKEKEKELAKTQLQELLKSKLKFKNLILVLLTLGIIFISILFFSYRNYHKKEKAASQLLKQKNDIVLIKNAEIESQAELLLKANQTKDLIFTILAHDLRNPLGQLQMVLSLMETDDLDVKEFETLLPKLSEGVKTTSETLDSLLYWAKTQMNGFKLNLTQHNLSEFIANESKNYQNLLSEKNLALVSNIPHDVTIVFDGSIIKVVFRNLLNNAVKFSSQGSQIEVNYRVDSSFYYLSIKDFGVGMSENQKNKLFSDLTSSTVGTKNEKGIGVGLIFCKDLVQKIKGNIEVESALNQGSTFTFSIPK